MLHANKQRAIGPRRNSNRKRQRLCLARPQPIFRCVIFASALGSVIMLLLGHSAASRGKSAGGGIGGSAAGGEARVRQDNAEAGAHGRHLIDDSQRKEHLEGALPHSGSPSSEHAIARARTEELAFLDARAGSTISLGPTTYPRPRQKGAPIAFLHIGKAGGSSFDELMKKTVEGLGRKYFGHLHYDWSYIQSKMPSADVITILRHPTSRTVSHWYFARTLDWTEGLKIRNLTLSQYLATPEAMMDGTNEIWQDGQSAVSWLTGTQTRVWVKRDESLSIEERQKMSMNTTQMCLLAAKRRRDTAWFGLLHRLDESMDMLASYLGLPAGARLRLPKSNQAKKSYPAPSAKDKAALASLAPMDMWLFEYAESLFEARLAHHLQGQRYIDPPLPPLPKITCFSTGSVLECSSGPLSSMFPRKETHASVYFQLS